MENETHYYSTLDAYRAGFAKLKNHPITFKLEEKKVVFCIPLTERLLQDLDAYEHGATVEALQLAMAIKNLKAHVFHLKKENEINGTKRRRQSI